MDYAVLLHSHCMQQKIFLDQQPYKSYKTSIYRLKGALAHYMNGRMKMHIDGLEGEQIHTILMLMVLNIIVFAALIVQIQARFAFLSWCTPF